MLRGKIMVPGGSYIFKVCCSSSSFKVIGKSESHFTGGVDAVPHLLDGGVLAGSALALPFQDHW